MGSAAYGSVFTRFWWADKGIFPLLFISCWSLVSDHHGGGGEELARERSSVQTTSVQHKSHFGSNCGDLVILRLQARIISSSEMNGTEVFIFTSVFGYILNCYPKAFSCGPTGCRMGVLDSTQ